jgi:hypothetical protein
MMPLSWTIKPVIKMVFITPYSKRTPLPEAWAGVRHLDASGQTERLHGFATQDAVNRSGLPVWNLKSVQTWRHFLCWTSWMRLMSWFGSAMAFCLLALTFTLALSPLASAQSVSTPVVQLSDFKLERQEDAYVLSSTLNFELPQAVEDALSKGIALFFMAEVQVAKERWYWYDKSVAKQERHYRLSYNPLSRRWRLATSSKPIPNSGLGVNMGVAYDSLSEALSGIKRSSEWRVVEASEIEPSGKYRLDYQFKLDLTQFPRPFQIGTLGESDWSMSVKKSQALVFEPLKSP